MKTKQAWIQFWLLGAVLLAFPAPLQAQFALTTNGDNTITITGYTGSGGNVIIPSVINGYPVKSIGIYAFSGSDITSAVIPDSVTNIEFSAFFVCGGLTNVVMSTNVTELPEEIFGFSGLTSFTFPSGLIKIDIGAFDNCLSLTNVVIPSGVQYIGDYAFNDGYCMNSVTIPDSVTYLGTWAYSGCINVTNLTIGNGISSIPGNGFSECTSLQSVIIPDSVTNVGGDAFALCFSLTNIVYGSGVGINIGSLRFAGTTNLNTITVSSNNPVLSSLDGVLFDKNQTTLIQCPMGKTGSYVIPNTVTSIWTQAFLNCAGLTDVSLGSTITSSGDIIFNGCMGVTNITLLEGVTNIFFGLFYPCVNLDSFTASPGNPCYSSVNGVLFDKNQTTLVQYPYNKYGSYSVPNGITSIWYGAFAYCSNLDNITLPNSLTDIGQLAFFNCSGLTNMVIPGAVTSIGNATFAYCVNLATVQIASSVTNLGFESFGFCQNLTSVYFKGNAPAADDTTFFYYPPNPLGPWIIPATIFYVPGTTGWSNTFAGCQTATWLPPVPFNYTTNNGTIMIAGYTGSDRVVTIPDKINSLPVTSIGSGAFSTTNIISVIMPESLTSIEDMAFYGCVDLASITFPGSITNIGVGAFNSCLTLRTVTIPASVTSIGDYAFFYCTNLTNISVVAANPRYSSAQGVLFNKHKTILVQFPFAKTGRYVIPGTVTNLADEAFGINDHGYVLDPYMLYVYHACPGLTNLTIPGSIKHIGDHAFSHCDGLTSVKLSGGIVSLGVEAFSWCSSLHNITIPDSVRNIGDLAFYYAGLKKVTIPGSVTNLGLGAFAVCSNLTTVTIQNGVTSIGEAGFNFCTNLTSVSLPDSLKSIGDRAFWFCTGLANVTIPRHVASIGSYAFSGCASLQNIHVSTGNLFYRSIDGVLCSKDQTTLIQFPGGRGGSYRVPSGITTIGDYAFGDYDPGFYSYGYLPACINLDEIIFPSSVVTIGFENFNSLPNLSSAYFEGNAPADFGDLAYDSYAIIYFLPGTTGWDTALISVPTAPWLPQMQTIKKSFGGQKSKFGFNINWTSNQVVVVEASTNLINWQPVQTNTLTTGSAYFSDPQWTNYPGRFYRLRSP